MARVGDSRGTILVIDAEADGGALLKVDRMTGAQSTVSSGNLFESPTGVAVTVGPGIVISDEGPVPVGTGFVLRVDPATGEQQTLSPSGELLKRPLGIAVEPSGGILIADAFASNGGAVIRIDPASGAQAMVSRGSSDIEGLPLPLRIVAVALDATGNILVVENNLAGGGEGFGQVVRIDSVTGTRTVVSSGGAFFSLSGVAVESNGSIVVTDANAFGGGGGVIRVDPSTGAQTTVSSGGGFSGPVDITVDADGSLLVVDRTAFGGNGGIFRIDPVSGSQTTVSSGGAFVAPCAIAMLPSS